MLFSVLERIISFSIFIRIYGSANEKYEVSKFLPIARIICIFEWARVTCTLLNQKYDFLLVSFELLKLHVGVKRIRLNNTRERMIWDDISSRKTVRIGIMTVVLSFSL